MQKKYSKENCNKKNSRKKNIKLELNKNALLMQKNSQTHTHLKLHKTKMCKLEVHSRNCKLVIAKTHAHTHTLENAVYFYTIAWKWSKIKLYNLLNY